jgi:hypothetical protein
MSNRSIINHQIHALQPEVKARSIIILDYAGEDRAHRFPEGLSWGFPFAMRLIYKDPTLDGLLVQKGMPISSENIGRMVCFEYQLNRRSIQIKKKPC